MPLTTRVSRNRFQRLALVAFVCVEILIFVGAIVRVSGSGLGCPDWPFCYGCLIPPRAAEDIDFTKLDLEKFRRKAADHGRDPATITPEALRAEFDPVATWVEYVNRLTSLPVGVSILALLIASFGQIRERRVGVWFGTVVAFVLVLLNAWLGAKVVLSGLKPGVITLHMALAVLLQGFLVYVAWGGTKKPWRLGVRREKAGGLFWLAMLLLALVVWEGIMGSQIREMTDQLSKLHQGENRSLWVGELEHTWVYVVHRSFSWAVLAVAIWFGVASSRALGRLHWLEKGIVGIVVAQMFLGLILAQVGIVRVVQVLHIGLSSLLVSGLVLWVLGAWRAGRTQSQFDHQDSPATV